MDKAKLAGFCLFLILIIAGLISALILITRYRDDPVAYYLGIVAIIVAAIFIVVLFISYFFEDKIARLRKGKWKYTCENSKDFFKHHAIP